MLRLSERRVNKLNAESAAWIAKDNGLEIILGALGLSATSLENIPSRSNSPVLVAIDTENMGNKKQRRKADCQVGLAIFDPQQPHRAISTYNFVSGSDEYYSQVAPRFLFGECVRVEKSDIGNCVESVCPASRDVILIGHSLFNELPALRALRIPLPFTCGVDTQLIAAEVLPDLRHPLMLSRLGNILGIPISFVHCAGNDAHFTLVALLGLACYHLNPASESKSQHMVFSLFQNLKASIAEIPRHIGVRRRKTKSQQPKKLRRGRDREPRHVSRANEKEAREGFDWSAVLYEIKLLYDTETE